MCCSLIFYSFVCNHVLTNGEKRNCNIAALLVDLEQAKPLAERVYNVGALSL